MARALKQAQRRRSARAWALASSLALALALALGGAAAGTEPLDLDGLMAALRQVQQVDADYTETVESDLLATAISTRGHLAYRAPDRIVKTGEQGESVEIRGETVRVEQGGTVQEIAIRDFAPLERLVGALRAIFSGDLGRLRADYALDFRRDGGRWTLDLRPRERTLLALFERMTITGREVDIDRIDIVESGGDRRLLRLHILSRRPAALP